MSADAAVRAYEEFRHNKEVQGYDPGEDRLKPWSMLTVREQQGWIQSWRVYTDNGEHGDPMITQRNKPRALNRT